MLLLEFLFLSLFILTCVFLLSSYISNRINSMNLTDFKKKPLGMLWFFMYAFFCLYIAAKQYSSKEDVNTTFFFFAISLPAWSVIFLKYIRPYYDEANYLSLIVEKKQNILRIIQLNHPKLKLYTATLFISVFFLVQEVSLKEWGINIVLTGAFLFVTNVILSKKYVNYDTVVLLIENNGIDQIKNYINTTATKATLLKLLYSMENTNKDFEFCFFYLSGYKDNYPKTNKRKEIFDRILNENNFTHEKLIMTFINKMSISEYSEITVPQLKFALKVLYENNKIEKIEELIDKNRIACADTCLYYKALIEKEKSNYQYARGLLSKIKTAGIEVINLGIEIDSLIGESGSKYYFSLNRHDYEISIDDYKRMSQFDKLFLKKYKMMLLDVFNNSCAKTGSKEEIEIDHFFIPKNEGGSFLLKNNEGQYIVNAVPLTKKVNCSKRDRSVDFIFSKEELVEIFKKLELLNNKINEELSLSE